MDRLVHSLKDYKSAKVYSEDLNVLIDQTEKAIAWYSDFKKYGPAKRILFLLTEELDTMKSYKNKCDKIVQSKGQVLR